jgi:hypothetical protein
MLNFGERGHCNIPYNFGTQRMICFRRSIARNLPFLSPVLLFGTAARIGLGIEYLSIRKCLIAKILRVRTSQNSKQVWHSTPNSILIANFLSIYLQQTIQIKFSQNITKVSRFEITTLQPGLHCSHVAQKHTPMLTYHKPTTHTGV